MAKRKVTTLEMTWGETASDNLKFNGRRFKQSRCFALTSIELLGAALFSGTHFSEKSNFSEKT
jgi:hypothetical protein